MASMYRLSTFVVKNEATDSNITQVQVVGEGVR